MNGIWRVDNAGFGNVVFLTEILAKPQGKKKDNLNLPSPSLWNGNGME